MSKYLQVILSLVSAMLSAVLLWYITRPPEPIPFEMPKWEYKIISIPDENFSHDLSQQGLAGWEVVFARRASDGREYSPTFSYELIVKRPLPPVIKATE